MHCPPIPPGMDTFKGRTFHSAKWDRSFDHAGKRVGVVGTGASGVQIIPNVAEKAGRTHVFQRHAAWSPPRYDRPFTKWEQVRK